MMGDRVAAGLMTPEQIVEAGLAASHTDGCVVVVHSSSQANVRWANNTVTTNGMATSVEFYVVAVSGRSAGTVAGSSADAVSAESVAAVVRAAEDAARAAASGGPANDAMALFGAGGLGAGGLGADGLGAGGGAGGAANAAAGGRPGNDAAVAAFADGAEATSFDVFGAMLPSLAAAFDDARSGNRILYGFARHEITTVHLGTSTGVRRRWVQPTGTFELNAKSADLARSSWTGASTVDFTDIDVAASSFALTERLRWAERRIDLAPGHYDTVLPPTSVADFLIYLAWSAAARPAYEGRSAFASAGGTRIGERLTERALTLYGDPTEPGLACAPFVETAHSSDEVSVFDNGAPAGRIELVKDGAIHDLIHTRASAAQYGAAFTPVVDNLILTGGDAGRSTADLVAGVERGLLITSLWYIREVDPMTLLLTGLTRDGVFLIENGEVTAAVNNFRFNVSPLDVLRRGVEVGETERCLSREWSDFFTRTAMPPVRVDGFHMSSVSKAQ